MATLLAFLAPLWASFLAYIAVNGISLTVKIVPVVLFVILVLVEWSTSSVWTHVGFVVLAILGVVTFLDLKGLLPIFPVVTPVKPVVKS